MMIQEDATSSLIDITPEIAEGLCDQCLIDAGRAYLHDRNVLSVITVSRLMADDLPAARRVAAEATRIRLSYDAISTEVGIRRSTARSIDNLTRILSEQERTNHREDGS